MTPLVWPRPPGVWYTQCTWCKEPSDREEVTETASEPGGRSEVLSDSTSERSGKDERTVTLGLGIGVGQTSALSPLDLHPYMWQRTWVNDHHNTLRC